MNAIQKIATDDGGFVAAFRQNVIRVIGNYGQTKADKEYEERIQEKQQQMVGLIAENAKSGTYTEEFDERYKVIAEEITELKEEQKEARRKEKLVQSYEQRVEEMDIFLQKTSSNLQEFDDELVRKLVENIKVISADEIMIQFKSGIVMNQRLNEEW